MEQRFDGFILLTMLADDRADMFGFDATVPNLVINQNRWAHIALPLAFAGIYLNIGRSFCLRSNSSSTCAEPWRKQLELWQTKTS